MAKEHLYSGRDHKYDFKRSGKSDLYGHNSDKFSFKRKADGGPLLSEPDTRTSDNSPPMRRGGRVGHRKK